MSLILAEFHKLGIKATDKSTEQKLQCPNCHADRKNKRDKPLSVNIDKGVYNCHNCGFSGNVMFKEKKQFTIPVEKNNNLSDRTVSWFAKRGISQNTLNNWKITESIEYFPQVEKRRKAINFNYYRENKLVNVKYRDGEKNFKMVSNAELIFYGIDKIVEMDKIYIVEGEIDALSLHEAGIYSVCSVPNGASKGNQKLEYLDNCFQYFKNKTEIVLCTDNDNAGLNLRKELARRFGQYRCKYVDFKEYKDANEILVKEGAEILRNYLNEAKSFPIKGVINVDDIWSSVLDFNENGTKNYSIGIGESDDYFKLELGQWSIVTGIPNAGKSDFIDQVCCNLAMKHEFKIGMFSPESFPFEGHIKRIANKLNENFCDNDLLNKTKNFIESRFFFVKINLESLSLKSILDIFRELVFQKGINVFVIDPYNQLDHTKQVDHSYIGRQLSEITQFVQQTNTHLFLIAHPRKMETENGIYKVPNPYDISGSSDFFNKAYNAICVYRSIGEKSKYGSDVVRIHIQKVKRKENGKQGNFAVAPNYKKGGMYEGISNVKSRITVIDDSIPF